MARSFSAVLISAIAIVLGSGPSSAQNAYITNSGSNTVSVIDTATNTVVSTIPVGSGPDAFGIFIQPPSANSGKDACKDGGWRKFVSSPGPFQNQGQCVSFFAKQP